MAQSKEKVNLRNCPRERQETKPTRQRLYNCLKDAQELERKIWRNQENYV